MGLIIVKLQKSHYLGKKEKISIVRNGAKMNILNICNLCNDKNVQL